MKIGLIQSNSFKSDASKTLLEENVVVEKKLEAAKAQEEAELVRNLQDARKEWLEAVASFEYAFEEELVDYFTYKMKACEARYTYFIKKAREAGLKAGFLQMPDQVV